MNHFWSFKITFDIYVGPFSVQLELIQIQIQKRASSFLFF